MRISEINRKTKETDITIKLNIDGTGESKIMSGIGFLDHMLESFAKHGKFDIELKCKGDTHVDPHHSVEDIGIVLGQAFQRCISDKTGLHRYGTAFTPMDEALSEVEVQFDVFNKERNAVQSVLDLSGRPYLVFNASFQLPIVGDFPTELVEEFFRAFTMNALITLHINVPYGHNTHHIIESIFKGTARALSEAIKKESDILLSTKGML